MIKKIFTTKNCKTLGDVFWFSSFIFLGATHQDWRFALLIMLMLFAGSTMRFRGPILEKMVKPTIMETGMTDLVVLQNGRARHLFGCFEEVESSKDDQMIKCAIDDLKGFHRDYYPFLDLTKEFELVIRDANGRFDKIQYEGFKGNDHE